MRSISSELASLDPAVRHMLREDLPEQLQQVQLALASKNNVAAAAGVHAVHGAAAFCRLESLRVAAAELENALKNNNRDRALIEAFESKVDDVLHALETQNDY